jgi:hypothetical protein
LLLYSSYLPLGVPNWMVKNYQHRHASSSFLAPLPGRKKKTSARGVFTRTSFTCFKFCFTLFLLASFYQKPQKISSYYSCYFCRSVIVLLYHAFYQWLVSLKLKSFWQGGFTEEQQNYYEAYRLSQKGKHLWEQINRLYIIARNVCSTYNVTYCFDRSCCCRRLIRLKRIYNF